MNIIEVQAVISAGIVEVGEIIRTSQYSNDHPVARQHLKLCEESLRDALRAPTDEGAVLLIAVATSELRNAKTAAEQKKAEQQNFVDGVYKSGRIGRGIYL